MTLLCVARCRPDTPREAAPGYRLCWPCRDWLGRNYAQLADLAPDLEAALSKANIVGEKVGGSREHAMELNPQAAAARWQIHHDIATTVRLVMDERGLKAAPRDDIEAMAQWLGKHVNWLAAHPSAAERSAEVQDWVSAAKNAINPNPPKRVQIGPCVIPDCPGVLSAVVRPQDSLLPSSIVCSFWELLADEGRAQIIEDGGEPHTWRADQWHALGRRMAKA